MKILSKKKYNKLIEDFEELQEKVKELKRINESLGKEDVTLDIAMVEIRDTVDTYDEYFCTGRKPQ